MPRFFIGDLLTGRRIQNLNVLTGAWTATLNAAGSISCTVSLRDPINRELGLAELAAVGKSFLACAEGKTILNAGPLWVHDYDDDAQTLSFTAAGMWSYFDHRVLLPVLAGRLPTDPTTNTRWTKVSVDPDDPWPVDTSKSYQGMVRGLVAQAQLETGGNVPVILPAEIPGSYERNYVGADVAMVGERIRQLTQVENGPDVRFPPRFTADMLGVEWPLLIGTPTQPLLFSPIDVTFRPSANKSSVSKLKVNVDGTNLLNRGFASGGRQSGESVAAVATSTALLTAGFPALDGVDTSHQTISKDQTVTAYANELLLRGSKPIQKWSFTHNVSQEPFLGSFSEGDFANVRMHDNPYVTDGTHRMRITQISGDHTGNTVDLTFQPEVS